MDKNQIFITSGTEYKKMTKELLEKADLQWRKLVGMAVCIAGVIIFKWN